MTPRWIHVVIVDRGSLKWGLIFNQNHDMPSDMSVVAKNRF